MGRFSKLETSQQKQEEAPGKTAAEPVEEEISYDAAYYCRQAEKEYFSRNLRRALQLFSRATQADAAHVDAWTGQILTLLALGERREALAWVNRAITVMPQQPRIVALQGLVFAHQGMVSRGLQCSDCSMAEGAGDPFVWFCRGQILTLANNKNAPFCMEKALESAGAQDWRIPAYIGYFYLSQRIYPLAEQYLNRAITVDSTNPVLWYQQGLAQMGLGKWQAARERFEIALKLDPEFKPAVQELESLNRSSWLARLIAFFGRRRK
ncbi:MAG: tetratricopeptide repeat protein [Candidatus Sumerlaeaceae bacterium]|nr:tetratricopeptide repeat protein [Candidatus Sumerlaeaceae bacterium]